MRCEYCENEAKYRYEGLNLCKNCLFDTLVNYNKIQAITITSWYLDGEFIGDSEFGLDIGDESIAEYFGIERVGINNNK